jgi:hypothetical protein
VAEALDALLNEDHDFGTMVVDSVDWLEPLIWAEACKRNGWASIDAPGFGKGYAEALTIWREYLDRLNALRDRKGWGLRRMVLHYAHLCAAAGGVIARYQRASSGLGTMVGSSSSAAMKAAKFFSPAMATWFGLQRHASWYLAMSFLVSLRFGGIISFRFRLLAGVVPSLSSMTLYRSEAGNVDEH